MTISSSTNKAGPTPGNDATTAFPFSFKTFQKSDLVVTLTDSTGIESTLTLDSDYSVVLNDDQNTEPGGTLTYPIYGSPLATGESLTIVRTVAALQGTDIQNLGGFYPEVIEDALDLEVMLVQQLEEKMLRAMLAPVSDATLDLELPNANDRAGQFFVWGATGKPALASGTGSDADLRTDLANTSNPAMGDALVGGKRSDTGAAGFSLDDYHDARPLNAKVDFGCVADGVTDDSTALQAFFDALSTSPGMGIMPPGDYYLASEVNYDGGTIYKTALFAYGAKILTSGAIAGLKITGGSTVGGATVYGLMINHRDNANALCGFDIVGTWLARLVDCSVEADDVSASYAAYRLRQSNAADTATGSFWTTLENCWCRKRQGADGTDMPYGVRIQGSCNATTIRGGGINNVTYGVYHTTESGQTYMANALLMDGIAFEGYGTAYIQVPNGATYHGAGWRLINCRLEDGDVVVDLDAVNVAVSTPKPGHMQFNSYVSNAWVTAFIKNTNSCPIQMWDFATTPDVGDQTLFSNGTITLRALSGADHPLKLVTTGGNRGLAIYNSAGNSIGSLVWSGTSNELKLQGVAAGYLVIAGAKSIGKNSVTGENLRGSATISGANTSVAVTFPTAEPDATYYAVCTRVSSTGAPAAGSETGYISSVAAAGFTINVPTAPGVGNSVIFNWIIIR